MSNQFSSINSLGYTGVAAPTPPQVILNKNAPTPTDFQYPIGTLWITQPGQSVYMLLGVPQNVATWALLFTSSSSGTSTFNCDTGSAVQSGSIINMFGENQITTLGSGNTIRTKLTDGTNGQVLLGGSTQALWKDITSDKNTIAFTKGVNTLNVEVSGAVTVSFNTDSGTATPSLGSINFYGISDITTTGSGNTITIQTASDIIIPGTITIDSLSRGVVQVDNSGLLFSSEGTDGQVLISSTTGVPEWANITSTGGTLTITNGSNSINLEVTGATTSSSRAFYALQGSNTLGVGPNGVLYELGKSLALTEIVDVGNNVYPGNGTSLPAIFTAPLTGKYFLKSSFEWDEGGGGYSFSGITTNNRDSYLFYSTLLDDGRTGKNTMEFCIVADMKAGDVATFAAKVTGSTGLSLNLYTPDTSISGFFIC